ncbi:MAG: hypothetical protein ACLPIX_21765 [Rhodomicrobium sp.]
MAGQDEDRSPDTNDDDELARKLARLTEEQQARYQTEVQNTVDRNVEASREYHLKLADTLLKDLPEREKTLEIRDLNRSQDQIAYQRDHERDQPDRPELRKAALQEPPAPERKDTRPSSIAQPHPGNSLDGKTPSRPPRDYGELQRTHQQVAGLLKQGERPPENVKAPGQSAQPEPAMLSKESLVLMLEHFPEIRREANLPTTQSEINERAALSRAQDADRLKLEQTHGAQPNLQQQHERNLLDYQHLAEQAGVQAKWIAQHLKAQASPEADQYKSDSRRAFHTARVTHEQRQNPGAGIGRSQATARGIGPDQQQQQAEAQEPAREGKELTSEQRANPSPEARNRIEREERSAAARELGARGKDQNAEPGNTNIGKSPSGGRSR